MKYYRTASTLFVLIISLGCSAEKANDFDAACAAFDELIKVPNYAKKSPAERNEAFENLLASKLNEESEAYIAWQAIGYAEAKERYLLFKEAALSTGVKSWSCESMSNHVHEVGQN